jgi:hypothetical protein
MRRIGCELVWALLAAAIGLGALLIAGELIHVLRDKIGGPLYHLDGRLREWTGDRPGGSIALGLLAAASSYAVRALLALRRQDDPLTAIARELRILATGGAASSVAFLATVIGSVQAQRMVAPTEILTRVLFSAGRIEHELVMWSITGAGLLLLTAIWGLVGVTWARRGSSRSALPIVTLAGLAAIVGVAGTSLLRWILAIPDISHDTEWMQSSRRYELILDTGESLIQGRKILIFVAALAAVGVLFAARRARPRPAVRREISAAAGLFAAGLAAFALTRGAAHDALHPLPFWDGSAAGWLDDDTVAALPPGEKCTLGLQDQPSIVGGEDGRFRLNSAPPQDPAELQEKLESSKALWLQVQPGKRFEGRLEAVIPAHASIAVVAPIVAAARAAGYAGLDVIEALPRRTYVTRTLGEISYRPRVCHVPIKADVELPRQGTWGDFVRSLPAP